MPYKRKVIFTSRNLLDVKSNIYPNMFDGRDKVGDAYRSSFQMYIIMNLLITLQNIMKILIIPTNKIHRNGVTNVIFNYLKALPLEDMQIDIVSVNDPEQQYKEEVSRHGGQIYVIPRNANCLFKRLGALKSLIQKNHFDIVHIHGNSHTVVLELLSAKAAGCGVRIVHSHSSSCTHMFVSKILTPLFNKLYTHALTCGNAAGLWMFGKRNFKVINNGVDTVKFAFNNKIRQVLREKYQWTDTKVIGHVGNFVPVKNQQFIIEVFNVLYKKDPSYRLLLIGDGGLRSQTEKHVDDLGLQNVVTFTGSINNVNEYLNAMDIILMPSLFEGLPLSLIEQQANGLQCVVSDAISTECDKSGNIKFLSIKQPVELWAKEIDTFLDKKNRAERSKKAIESISQKGYSIQKEAIKLRDYYLNATKKNLCSKN